MIGVRVGARIGAVVKVSIGLTPQVAGVTVAKDGPSSVYVPGSAADFTALSITPANSLWKCQEASGNLADSIGALTLTASGTVGYATSVPGWTRKGVTMNDGTSGGFRAASGVGPNPATTSSLWLGYVSVTAAAANRAIMGVTDGATFFRAQAQTTGKVLRANVSNLSTADGATDITALGVIPIAILYDVTNSRAALYSRTEKLVPTYSGAVDGNKGFGLSTLLPPAMSLVWACMWSGANAEINDAAVKTRLTSLGWVVTWT